MKQGAAKTTGKLWTRAIAHVDLDQFYAAVEVLDFPELKGKPVIVGGTPGKRGVVSTASYEARAFGVHSAMPSTQAAKLCPQGIWRAPRMSRYAELSRGIRAIFARYTDLIEPISLDEAFLDVTGSQRLFGTPESIGLQIKRAILDELKLVASVGVAENKFLAKVASDLKKPDALVLVPPGREQACAFLAPLPLKRLWGAGPKTCARLETLGYRTIADLANGDRERLRQRIGPGAADHLMNLARGIDDRDVEVGERPKSVGKENTFAENVVDRESMERELLFFAEDVAMRLRAKSLKCAGVTLKVRYGDFSTLTRAFHFEEPTDLAEPLHEAAVHLLRNKVELGGRGVRLLGLTAHKLLGAGEHTEGLFPDPATGKRKRAAEATDRLKARFGRDAVTRARLLEARPEDTGSLNESPPELRDGAADG